MSSTKRLPLFSLLLAVACFAQANGRLQLHFIDVGQGDGALLISPGGETVLFDNGVAGHCDKPVAYLLRLGVKGIDYHIASHYHSDHIGCTAEVFGQLPLRKDALDRGGRYDSGVFERYVAAVGAHRKTAQAGGSIVLDAGSSNPVRIDIVALNADTADENGRSIVAVVHYGAFDAELGGDLTAEGEALVGARMQPVELYKVHHHGSRTSTSAAWLARTRPKAALLSVGEGNTYGHPTRETLDRLHAAGVQTYWTSRGEGAAPEAGRDVVAGNIVVEADPAGFRVLTDRYSVWESVVTAAVNAASFQGPLSPGAWASLFGANLAPSARLWRGEEIVDGVLPTELDGVRVTVNGKPAAISYISPGQLNVQIPDDDAPSATIEVTTPNGAARFTTALERFSPGLFSSDGIHAAYLGAARPGEIISLFGTGFGPSAPDTPAGRLVSVPARFANPVRVLAGGIEAAVDWAGVSAAGLAQINVRLPENLPAGEVPVIAEIAGRRTQVLYISRE